MLPLLVLLAQIAQVQASPRTRLPAADSPFSVRFAVVGDYGQPVPAAAAVAARIAAWNPELVITTGDNNYPDGEQATIDANIGQYYSAFIHPYVGSYGPGASTNRFFPSLGNHDWVTPGAAPYLAYFTLPGNERYYDFVRGPVHFLAVDSDVNEPDGNTAASAQADWLRSRLATSRSPFRVVYLHHPPYSSSSGHGSQVELQWPYREWGASVVLAGHDHVYERIDRDGFPYIVCGTGGANLTSFSTPVAGSALRYAADHGAMIVEADDGLCVFRFVNRTGIVHDTFSLPAAGVQPVSVEVLPVGSTWKYRDDGSNQGSAWRAIGFDDSSWASGPAQLGYGDGDEATLVGYGPDPANKYITTWFRRSFNVATPGDYRRMLVEILRDDGAVVYVNGTEVLRTNLPGGTIGHLTPASSAISGPDETAFVGGEFDPSLLVAGTNVLAVEIHQVNGTSSDISLDLRLRGILRGTVLSAPGALWRYRDNGIDPGPAWTQPGFDDSAWSSGPAQLGYGDGDEATLVGYGPDPANKHVTTWFRRSFLAPAGGFQALLLRVLRDDGLAVHLNGVEVHRENLPWPAMSSASFAGSSVSGADESAFLETHVPARLLVPGLNVLAVEVHQVSPTSSDLSFELELLGL